jgi:imidazolonepropionase
VPQDVDLLIDGATLVTVDDDRPGSLAGAAQAAVAVVPNGALAVAGGRIAALGPAEAVRRATRPREALEADGRVVLPGLVDPHTHPLWAGSRAGEFELRAAGASYLEISASGGGIASTVRATRHASDEELLRLLVERLDRFLSFGTTTLEAKSGYGLSGEQEERQMRLLAEARARHPLRLVLTFLGAHAVPDEFRGRSDQYVDLVVEQMLPTVARQWPDAFCDVFCDEGAFTPGQTERVLLRARELGLCVKAHSDEFANLGCTELAAELGAISIDHLAATRPDQMDAMARAGSVAVLLPGTTFGLGEAHFADARQMVARGVPVALGTDYNPGTCPCENLLFMVALATRYMHLTPAEAVVAVTRNAAAAVGRDARAGRLAVGRPADLVLLESDDYRDVAYRFGSTPVCGVMIEGVWLRGPTGCATAAA